MTHKAASLRARLHQAGIAVNENDTQASPPIPWFIRVLQAFSGWLAAMFLLGFIAMVAASVVESTLGSLSLGAMMLLAAFGLFRVTRSDVGEHLAIAVSLAGQLLVAWGLVNVWETSAYLWWALLGLQGVLALVMPSHTHRGFSAFAASVALYMALAMSAMEPVASGMVLLALTALWLNEFRWPTRITHVQAWGYGLLVGLLVMQGMAHAVGSLLYFDAGVEGIWATLAPWLGVALVALALGVLLLTRLDASLSARARGAAFVGAVVLLIVTYHVPSVGQGVVVMLLGVAVGHRVLVGVGMLSLLLGIGSYYYSLETTLLMKSLTLLLIGGLLLLLRWALRRWLGSPTPLQANGSRDHDA
ncbi:DUF4401 domain-containing protein [Halovibrio sp. HP20-50]|uniref:DUF4401 domain-containing protein n=1 Tax=Halovibrio sp. HP20-59 TaxID=3080275 RepID=UPI00294ABE12|nr:DUF4401 domain-containing protein [Halovibrio sp. HP20-59]MEA2119007.1 DUF4401 domain-containing protein [Halovibrio sp. HP20-59]